MDGFEVPINNSLTQPILIGGVPREIAILNGTLASALVLGLHSPVGIPIGLILHFLTVAMAQKDPQFFETFRRQVKQKRYYGV
jgi:type IV secretion system protein VirB3